MRYYALREDSRSSVEDNRNTVTAAKTIIDVRERDIMFVAFLLVARAINGQFED